VAILAVAFLIVLIGLWFTLASINFKLGRISEHLASIANSQRSMSVFDLSEYVPPETSSDLPDRAEFSQN
jgi:hypothetical protein